MGALYCQERDIGKMTVKARSFCLKMGQKWRLVLDLTYPHTSMMSGFGFNALIEEVFNDTQIEDLWLPFFTITTDISVSSMRVHEMGSTWRYIRGSMSLGEICFSLYNSQIHILYIFGSESYSISKVGLSFRVEIFGSTLHAIASKILEHGWPLTSL